MEDLILLYFKDKPWVLGLWHRYKSLATNIMLLVAICVSILAQSERYRSLGLGLAAGIVLINIGQNINKVQSRLDRKVSGTNE